MSVEIEASVAEAVEADDVAGDATELEDSGVDAGEEGPRAKGKTASKRDAKFAEMRRTQREAKEAIARAERIETELAQERAERAREREEDKQWREELKRDHQRVLQRDLAIPREELLAAQADEANLDPRVRRELIELRTGREEDRKFFRTELERFREERQQERHEAGISSDIEKSLKLVDEEMHPSFAALPSSTQAAMIEHKIREAARNGTLKGLNRADLVGDLDEQVEDLVNHIRGGGKATREVAERRAPKTPKALTRSVGSQAKTAPSASGPMSEDEARQFALQNLAEKRMKREQERLEKARAKSAAKG